MEPEFIVLPRAWGELRIIVDPWFCNGAVMKVVKPSGLAVSDSHGIYVPDMDTAQAIKQEFR